MKLEYSLTPYTKINSKCLKELNIRHDTFTVSLEENIGKILSDKNHKQCFLNSISQGKRNKSKNKQMGPNETSICTAKETTNKIKTTCVMEENICKQCNLISKIHKQLNIKKQTTETQ